MSCNGNQYEGDTQIGETLCKWKLAVGACRKCVVNIWDSPLNISKETETKKRIPKTIRAKCLMWRETVLRADFSINFAGEVCPQSRFPPTRQKILNIKQFEKFLICVDQKHPFSKILFHKKLVFCESSAPSQGSK